MLTCLVEDPGDLCLSVAYPVENPRQAKKNQIKISETTTITAYGFTEDTAHPEKYRGQELIPAMQKIMDDACPDVLHIFGTEYAHSLAALKAYGRPHNTLVGLQGIIWECARQYMADLPPEVYKKATFRDRLKNDSLQKQQQKFALRGEREKETLRLTGNVTGRTDFDRQAAAAVNPEAVYFPMNEILREEFYTGRWHETACVPHRIFFSQADYPLKGFHYLLQALKKVKRAFPDVTVAVAGNSLVNHKTLKDKLKLSAYGKYLLELMEETGLTDKVTFTGRLTAEEMKQQYLSCHTFVCASSLENSPNSVGEAMLLGVPVIASRTGGIPSMVQDGKEGLLFEKGNTDALAEALISLWKNPELTGQLSEAAARRAAETHSREKNYDTLKKIYQSIV
jgi:glycosyltransferase involved in cell wall biosynthesis